MIYSPPPEPEAIIKTIGNNIRFVREARNISVLMLSKLAHYDRNCLIKLEQGKLNISYKSLIKLVETLNCSFPAIISKDIRQSDITPFIPDNYLQVFTENIKYMIKPIENASIKIYANTGIQPASISRLLNGKNTNPSITTLFSLASCFPQDFVSFFIRHF